VIKLLYVGLGGCIGACARYIVSTNSARIFGAQFPYGTLVVNVAGAILIGLIMEFTNETISPDLRLFLTTGIMGGLTTFSTFSYETINLFSSGSYFLGILNTCLNLFLSFGGVALGKLLFQAF
jgi:CrcB protein